MTVSLKRRNQPADKRSVGAPGCTFYLGTHEPGWLARVKFPLCVSHRRLRRYRRLPAARCAWILDSGAFSELSMYGCWKQSPVEYVAAVRRYRREIGRMAWAGPQDWMVEPAMLVKTGLSVVEHQRRTVENFVELRRLAPELPIMPVLQGWLIEDYLCCVDRYAAAGIDLTDEPIVGIGSVCRRQASDEIASIVERLSALGLRLHGFGVKADGLERYGHWLASADSMAWSFRGRYVQGCGHRLPGQRPVASEANCLTFARHWRRHVVSGLNCHTNVSGGLAA